VRHYTRLTAILCGCFCLVGCFEAKYEARLQHANSHFKHQEVLDANLAPPWLGNGLSFRVPKQFALIPPAETPSSDDKAKPAAPPLDPRQPDFLGMDLPGLVGAWKAPAPVEGQNSYAYLYLLTNQSLLAMTEQDRPNPSEFINKTMEDLTRASKLTLAPESWITEKFPKQAGFIPQVTYQSAVQESPREVAGQRMRYSIYQRIEGDLQIILLFVIPTRTTEPIADKIPLSLETLVVQGAGGGGAAASSSAPAAPKVGAGL